MATEPLPSGCMHFDYIVGHCSDSPGIASDHIRVGHSLALGCTPGSDRKDWRRTGRKKWEVVAVLLVRPGSEAKDLKEYVW